MRFSSLSLSLPYLTLSNVTDPENPFNLSKTTKWFITGLTTFFTAEVAATAGAFVPGIPSMQAELNLSNHTVALLGVSLYALGFGFVPLGEFGKVRYESFVLCVMFISFTLVLPFLLLLHFQFLHLFPKFLVGNQSI